METKVIDKNLFDIIKSTVNKMADLIRPTFGPASNKVIIDRPTHAMVVDDGVQIARDLQLPDPIENAIVKVIRETAIKTNERVGDGTTGAILILQALINEVARRSKVNGREIEIELKKELEEVKKQLLDSVVKIESKEDLKKVAMVSFDNEKVAEIISDLYFKYGRDATITVEKSQTMEIESKESGGIKIDSGYISPYMITNPQRMEAEIAKPYILITDHRLMEFNDILPIMEKLIEEKKRSLVIIAEHMEGSALSTAIINKIQGKFVTIAINAPKDPVMLADIAMVTGAKLFSQDKGDKLPTKIEEVNLDDLGRASKFICRQNESIIVKPEGDKVLVAHEISQLELAVKNETVPAKKEALQLRLSRLTNKIAVIKAGAFTDNEQIALKYKIEDAINSTKCAYKNGVVPGAGMALGLVNTSSSLLNNALKYPYRQLYENMDVNAPDIQPANEEIEVTNLVTGEKGNFMDVGVADPVDTLIAGVESAVSIASLLLTSSGIICEYQEKNGK